MRKIRAIVVGCGNMGRIGVRFLMEKGIEIVGAYGVNPETLGKDIGIVAGLDKPLGIRISHDLERLIDDTKPDVAVHAMYSTMAQNEAVFTTLLRKGINIVTTCDDSHYAYGIEPEVCHRLDQTAKDGGATLIGTGIQDVFFLHLGYIVAGACISLKEITVTITNNLDDYGLTSAKRAGAGLTVNEFNDMIKSRGDSSSTMTTPINGGICAKFGLTPLGEKMEQLPYVKEHDVYSGALNSFISAGKSVGISEQLTTETAEGITIRSKYDLYIYDGSEKDVTAWHICGVPDYDIEIPGCKTPEGTMATLINRIPDAINADPGYYANSQLLPARFHLGH